MAAQGLNFHRVAVRSGVDPKTAKAVIETGMGKPGSVYLIAKLLGFKVKCWGDPKSPDAQFDLSAVVKAPVEQEHEPRQRKRA